VSGPFCVHGHFYQPAREHPWLEVVEVDDSAAPAHDWNERVTAECYAPNAAARILDDRGRIVRIVNNYERISFNVGPTLAGWLERHAPETYAMIVRADHTSAAAHGYGNAIAQAYNHLIMPLATREDKATQVRWGIADFRRRFGRMPEGMWLPETAVDLETLAVLAACGIRFTILAPHQAARVRVATGGEWVEVSPQVLDTTRPYLCRPAPGLEIALFFYESAVAHDIAFNHLLANGNALAERLLGVATDTSWSGERLVHVATDGETYGHHHRFGEMALAYAIEVLEDRGAEMTNYGTFLADHPPTHEVQIHERTSWSCAHGVERWRADCGCRTRGDWHQRWRGPLRGAMDWLKSEVDALFEQAGASVFHDPWAARDAYVNVILNRTDTETAHFLGAHAQRPADPEARLAALRLLEMQRHAMLMFASDGWFFDEISGVETVQVLRHAARVMQLAAAMGRDVEQTFVERLRAAESNLPAYGNGAVVYDRLARPALVDHRRVAAHAAIMSLFQEPPRDQALYAYRVGLRDARRGTRGPHTLLTGRADVASAATGAASTLSYAVLHFGGTDVHCCTADAWSDATHASAADALAGVFESGSVTEVVRAMDSLFGRDFHTLRDLFTEQRRAVLARLSADTLAHLESSYRRIYRESRGLMETLRDADVPVPREFLVATEFVLMTDVRRALTAPGALPAAAWDLFAEARSWGIVPPAADLEPLVRARIERHLRDADGLFILDNLVEVGRVLDFAQDIGITPNLWQAQNLFAIRLAPRLADAPPDVRRTLEHVAERLHFSLESLSQGLDRA
jgi:alpha-amylase/alpha-mannosidase (GH57 family)